MNYSSYSLHLSTVLYHFLLNHTAKLLKRVLLLLLSNCNLKAYESNFNSFFLLFWINSLSKSYLSISLSAYSLSFQLILFSWAWQTKSYYWKYFAITIWFMKVFEGNLNCFINYNRHRVYISILYVIKEINNTISISPSHWSYFVESQFYPKLSN